MRYDGVTALPCRIAVSSLLESRYGSEERPLSWDERRSGLDVVRTGEGLTLKLHSNGGQEPPRSGWVLLLMGGNEQEGYSWTLYGLPKGEGQPKGDGLPKGT